MSAYTTLKADWKKGKSYPVYLFYGEEEFLRHEALDLAIETFVPEPSTRSLTAVSVG